MLDLRLLGFVWKVFFKITGKKKPFLKQIKNKKLFLKTVNVEDLSLFTHWVGKNGALFL